jgi:hypothetical protein
MDKKVDAQQFNGADWDRLLFPTKGNLVETALGADIETVTFSVIDRVTTIEDTLGTEPEIIDGGVF